MARSGAGAARGLARLRRRAAPLHLPAAEADGARARRARLAYDELLADQVAIGRARRRPGTAAGGHSPATTGCARRRWPGSATRRPPAQAAALAEIDADLARPRGCCGCCRATSAPARRWWRCWRCCARWRPGRRPPDGADRDPGAPAPPHPVAALAGAGGAADRRGQGRRAAGGADRAGDGRVRWRSAPMRCSRTGCGSATWAWR